MRTQDDEPCYEPEKEQEPRGYEDSLRFAALKRREVYLDERVGSEMAARIVREISLLSEKPDPITIRISSNGGSVESEFAIVDAIHAAQRKGCIVTGEVYGHGMSAAFEVLQTCNVRKMGKSAFLMVHGITSWTVGDLRDLNAEQKLLARLHREAAKFHAERSTAAAGTPYKTEEFWLTILEANTPVYLFPEEALEWGMVDAVED